MLRIFHIDPCKRAAGARLRRASGALRFIGLPRSAEGATVLAPKCYLYSFQALTGRDIFPGVSLHNGMAGLGGMMVSTG